jgi:hypothetical protein
MPRRKNAAAAAAKTELRRDIFIYNEATAFLITSLGMRAKGFYPLGGKWAAAVKKGQIIPIELYQDDSFIVRFVVNGPLTEQEEDEWLGKFVHKLSVKNGHAVVAGGMEFVEEESQEEEENDFMGMVDVANGDYRAEVYTYINSVNADALLERADEKKEPLGAYFRRTREGTPFPSWLQALCTSGFDLDPGHEEEWADKRAPDDEPYIGILIRLTPLDKEIPVGAKLIRGVYGPPDFECRKPARCPLGLLGQDVQKLPGSGPAPAPRPVVGLDVGALLADKKPAPLEEAIPVPLADFHHTFLPAWYAASGSHPEVIIDVPAPADADKLAEALASPARQIVRSSDNQVRVRWEISHERWEMPHQTRLLSRNLSEAALPDGSALEMCTSNPHGADSEAGRMRWNGKVRAGVWHLDEMYPVAPQAAVQEALRLGADGEGGKRLGGLNPAAIQQAMRYFRAQMGRVYSIEKFHLQDGVLSFEGEDSMALHLMATSYFRERFAGIWAVTPVEQRVRDQAARLEAADQYAKQVVLTGEGGRTFTAAGVGMLGAQAVTDFEKFKTDVQAIQGKLIGELACSQFNRFVFVYFALPDGHTRIVWYRGTGPSSPNVEIISDFEDGASLSTSRQRGPGDEPGKKIFRTRIPDVTTAELYGKHLERCDQLKSEHGGLRAFDGTLIECARRFEEGIQRQS